MYRLKLYVLIVMLSFFIFPIATFAYEDNEFVSVSEEIKYYKTITYNNTSSLFSMRSIRSESFEISEDEYNSADITSSLNNYNSVVETTYKRMTTTILKNGNYYRYKVTLDWKNMPATRSYDIIGIGFYNNLKVKSSLYFSQEYCYSGGDCTSSSTNYPQTFDAGAGTTFKLPTGTLSSLKQTLYFDVEKEVNSTFVAQDAYGDYSHATQSISLNNAKKYTVNKDSGIVLNSSISSYYDSISVARASWTGVW